MKFGKFLAFISLASSLLIGCAKDKNLDDFNREQLLQTISKINSVSGSYSGVAVSKLDGTNLGAINLKFSAKTDVQSTSTAASNRQTVNVSGALSFFGLTNAEITFDNGIYDDVTGDFQVTIPITQAAGSSTKLYLAGHVNGDQWIGSLEVNGQSDYGTDVLMTKNAPLGNISKLEVGGIRLEQIRRTTLNYVGTYKIGNELVPFRLGFINREILPEQNLFKLLSPVRSINVVCDFTDFELNFTNVVIDDKMGTLHGHDPIDQRGAPARATLFCQKFDLGKNDFGYDCQVQTKTTLLNIHVSAKQ